MTRGSRRAAGLRELPRWPLHPGVQDHVIRWSGGVPTRGGSAGRRQRPATRLTNGPAPGDHVLPAADSPSAIWTPTDATAREHAVGARCVWLGGLSTCSRTPYPAAVEGTGGHRLADNAGLVRCGRLAAGGGGRFGGRGRWPRSSPNGPGGPGCAPNQPGGDIQLLCTSLTMWDTSTALPSPRTPMFRYSDHAAIAAFMVWYAGHLDPPEPPADLAPGRRVSPAWRRPTRRDCGPLTRDGFMPASCCPQAGVEVELHNAETPGARLSPGYSGWCRRPEASTVAWRRCGRRCTSG